MGLLGRFINVMRYEGLSMSLLQLKGPLHFDLFNYNNMPNALAS